MRKNQSAINMKLIPTSSHEVGQSGYNNNESIDEDIEE